MCALLSDQHRVKTSEKREPEMQKYQLVRRMTIDLISNVACLLVYGFRFSELSLLGTLGKRDFILLVYISTFLNSSLA